MILFDAGCPKQRLEWELARAEKLLEIKRKRENSEATARGREVLRQEQHGSVPSERPRSSGREIQEELAVAVR